MHDHGYPSRIKTSSHGSKLKIAVMKLGYFLYDCSWSETQGYDRNRSPVISAYFHLTHRRLQRVNQMESVS